jgi:hypothetical protein
MRGWEWNQHRRPRRQDLGYQAVVELIAGAAFPKLVYRLRWRTRLRGRGLLVYVAFNTLLLFAVRVWVLPWVRRIREEWERIREELRLELGREPTDEEVLRRQFPALGR